MDCEDGAASFQALSPFSLVEEWAYVMALGWWVQCCVF